MAALYRVQSKNYYRRPWGPSESIVGMTVFATFEDAVVRANELLDQHVRIVRRRARVWESNRGTVVYDEREVNESA